MKILDTAIRQRSYDGMWMLMAKVPDYDNTYRFKSEDDKPMSWVPDKWIVVDVKSEKNDLRLKFQSKRTNNSRGKRE